MSERWSAMATLVDDGRRALFEYVQRAGHPVSREEAADALGISRGLAAFHLDKLVDAGLLHPDYQAPAGQPRGRGRTPKVYRAIDGDVAISVPERDYELAAMILADAVAADPDDAAAGVRRSARRHGLKTGARLSAAKVGLFGALHSLGFHPRRDEQRVLLDNCPFHALAARQTDLVCGLNLEFVGGLVDGLGEPGCRAKLAPSPGRCCVEIETGAS